MALLERVSTLVRANLNDLIDKAEDPEKMIKQVILDMQNQLLQVKTQVAIAIADQHLLEKKQKENEEKVAEWMRKAELAVDKKQDDLARAALHRVESYREMSDSFAQQVSDQKAQVENLKTALRQLDQKLAEAQAKADLLIAQHRRARAVGKASDARIEIGDGSKSRGLRPHEAQSRARGSGQPGKGRNRRRRRRRPPGRTREGRSHRAVADGDEERSGARECSSDRFERTNSPVEGGVSHCLLSLLADGAGRSQCLKTDYSSQMTWTTFVIVHGEHKVLDSGAE